MNEGDILERIRTLRREIEWIRRLNREYRRRARPSQAENQLRDDREARLVEIREEIASLATKRLTPKH